MDINYNDIIERLEPYKDKVFFRPLTENQIAAIESHLDKKFPTYYRQFLSTFGVRQDLVFGLYGKESDFATQYDYLPDELKPDFVGIGDNGGEDFWLINIKDPFDIKIYEWQHYADGDVVPLAFNFNELLENSIKELSESYSTRESNSKKSWFVQFAIETDDENKILNAIDAIKTKDWKLDEVSSAGVSCFSSEISIKGILINFRRQEYAGWSNPQYYFDLNEPVLNYGTSQINFIDSKLRATCKDYTLVDYGILPSDTEED